MNKLQKIVQASGRGIRELFHSRGALLIYSLMTFCYLVFQVSILENKSQSFTFIPYFIPFVIILYILFYKVNNARKPIIRVVSYIAVSILQVCVIWIHYHYDMTYDLLSKHYDLFFVANILALILLILFEARGRGNQSVISGSYRVLSSLLLGSLFTSIMGGIIATSYAALILIIGEGNFTHSIHESVFLYICIFCGYIVMPLAYSAFDIKSQRMKSNSNLTSLFYRYLLVPGFTIYSVLTLIYFIKLLVLWQMPEGTVSWLMIALFLGGLVAISAKYYDPTRMAKGLFNLFKWVMIPAIALLVWALSVRVSEYGWTELRVYLAAVALVMLLTVLTFFVRRERAYFVLFSSTAILLFILNYSVVLTAKHISISLLSARFERDARTLGLIDDSGTMVSEDQFVEISQANKEAFKRLNGIYNYLYFREDSVEIVHKYDRFHKYANTIEEVEDYDHPWIEMECTESIDIDLSKYQRYINFRQDEWLHVNDSVFQFESDGILKSLPSEIAKDLEGLKISQKDVLNDIILPQILDLREAIEKIQNGATSSELDSYKNMRPIEKPIIIRYLNYDLYIDRIELYKFREVTRFVVYGVGVRSKE